MCAIIIGSYASFLTRSFKTSFNNSRNIILDPVHAQCKPSVQLANAAALGAFGCFSANVKCSAITILLKTGFRPARGCRDNVCALKWFIEMILRDGRHAVITVIVYSAAFNKESQMFLDEALAEAGVGAKVRRIVQAIFAAATGVVRLRHPDGTMTLSEPFDIARGVLQGDIFSPVGFIAGLDRIFRMHDLQNPALQLAWARVRPSCRSSSTRMTLRSSMRMLRQRLPE